MPQFLDDTPKNLQMILTIVLFAIGAAFVQRTTGFGFGIFIMTVLPFIMPSYGEATALSGMLAMITSLYLTLRYYRHIPWRRLLPILATFIIVSAFAVGLLTTLRNEVLQKILGVVLIAAATYFWFFAHRVTVRPTFPTQTTLGTLSGIMGGLFGMQGPPAVLYFLQITETKEQYTAMAQAYFLFGNLTMTVFRACNGFVTSTVLSAWCWGLPAVLAGTFLGNLVFNRLSLPALRRVVYIYIALSGIVALVK